jgi:hypothetical protein
LRFKLSAICLIALMAYPTAGGAYSLFTHQELIDMVWDRSIRPVLLERYPGLTERELNDARAYAYGGSIIQDMGYYPAGHRYFSNLTHYVRTGDFVTALFDTSRNANELAFAMGALSHYVGDSIGHSEAVNPAVGATFPNLARKYGPIVTFEEDPIEHGRVEFGFDIAQLAKRQYTPEQFRRLIGFQVADRALDRALLETYGLGLVSTLGHAGPDSYRFSVRKVMPLFGRTEVVRLDGRFHPDRNDEALRQYLKFVGEIAREHQWAGQYTPPGWKAHFFDILFRGLPPIGPLKVVDVKAPTTETGDWFVRSLNRSQAVLSGDLERYASAPARFRLENLDLDTGYPVAPGRYWLTDQTYARLLNTLTSGNAGALAPDLVHNILAYYSQPNAPISTKRHPEKWKRVRRELAVLETRYPAARAN